MELFKNKIWNAIAVNGISNELSSYNKRRALIYNQLNFIALVLSVIREVYILFISPIEYTAQVGFINASLIIAFSILPIIMYYKKYAVATILSFLIIPVLLNIVSYYTNDKGMELYLVLYCILPFFYLNKPSNTIIAFIYCFTNCFVFFIIQQQKLDAGISVTKDLPLIVINYLGGFVMVFFTLYMVKHQVWTYQKSIKIQKEDLLKLNEELVIQKNELQENKLILNKMFSIVCHDLKTPIYGLKNIFSQSDDKPLTYTEFQELLPYINKDIDDTVTLMENVLSWAQNQIENTPIDTQKLDIYYLIQEVIATMQKDAKNKKVIIISDVITNTFIWADRLMLLTVIKNILSNAVKYSRTGGCISLTTSLKEDYTEIKINDTGVGIDKSNLPNIFKNDFYNTLGTNGETGAGLGLLICKELLHKNKGDIKIESIIGMGTTVTLLIPNKDLNPVIIKTDLEYNLD